RRHGLPVVRGVAAHDRLPERGLLAEAAETSCGRGQVACRGGTRTRRSVGLRAAWREPALRWTDAACGTRPLARDAPLGAHARRAAVEPRRPPARPSSGGTA